MAKVLCISSQVVWGPVGNTAAVPALDAQGHEVLQVPTILLSHHPGHGTPVVQRTDAALMRSLLASVAERQALDDCGAVLTGYFASDAQVQVAAEVIATIARKAPGLVVAVDPVLGDDGRLYVAEAVAAAIRDHLVPQATVLTPNAFELAWLTGAPVQDQDTALAAARLLSASEVIVTSVPAGADGLVTLLVTPDGHHAIHARRRAQVPNGTGDFLAGAYLAARLTQAPAAAFTSAMARLEAVIARSAGSVLRNT